MEKLSINSFLAHGHKFHLYVYNDIKDVPIGAEVKDANDIISAKRIFKYKHRDSYAGFANLFRYKLLLDKGGFWVDLDTICLKPFSFPNPYVFSGTKIRKRLFPFVAKNHIQNCVIGASANAEIMNYCFEVANNKDPEKLAWGETGPDLLESAVYKFGLEDFVLYGTFSPVVWQKWKNFISGSPLIYWKVRTKLRLYNSHAIHLYNEMWRLEGINKNAVFPQTSIYEWLKNRYSVVSLGFCCYLNEILNIPFVF